MHHGIDLFIGNAHGQEQIQYVYLYINSLWIKKKKDINNNIHVREYLDTCFHGNHLKKNNGCNAVQFKGIFVYFQIISRILQM
jgi:hypothetical protein